MESNLMAPVPPPIANTPGALRSIKDPRPPAPPAPLTAPAIFRDPELETTSFPAFFGRVEPEEAKKESALMFL